MDLLAKIVTIKNLIIYEDTVWQYQANPLGDGWGPQQIIVYHCCKIGFLIEIIVLGLYGLYGTLRDAGEILTYGCQVPKRSFPLPFSAILN